MTKIYWHDDTMLLLRYWERLDYGARLAPTTEQARERLAAMALEDCKHEAVSNHGSPWPEQLYTVPHFAWHVYRWLEPRRWTAAAPTAITTVIITAALRDLACDVAKAAYDQGARAPWGGGDMLPGDVAALTELLGREATVEEAKAFRSAFEIELDELTNTILDDDDEADDEADDDEADDDDDGLYFYDAFDSANWFDNQFCAANLAEALEMAIEWARAGEWGVDATGKSVHVIVRVSGPDGEDSAEIIIDPTEPPCDDDEHDWQRGKSGCRENPGVWGDGAATIIHEICALCGIMRITTVGDVPGPGCRNGVRYEKASPDWKPDSEE